MCEEMQRLSSIEKMGDKRSAASYWNMREKWGTELHVHCCKTTDRNERLLSYIVNSEIQRH
jgi:hypothetical protein